MDFFRYFQIEIKFLVSEHRYIDFNPHSDLLLLHSVYMCVYNERGDFVIGLKYYSLILLLLLLVVCSAWYA